MRTKVQSKDRESGLSGVRKPLLEEGQPVYLRKVERHYKESTYTHYLLVESVHTKRGPRQRIVCSLGDLKPKPPEEWLHLFEKAVDALRRARRTDAKARPSVA